MSYIRQLLIRQALRHKTNRPSGLIGQYKPYLNSNDSPTRDILKDYSGQGHDIQLYNFGYALGSGYGKYGIDFSNNVSVNYSEIGEAVTKTNSVFSFEANKQIQNNSTCVSIFPRNTNSWKLKVEKYGFVIKNTNKDTIMAEGEAGEIIEIPGVSSEDINSPLYFYAKNTINEGDIVTLEQIPDYPGALVSDGVDDYGLCENFPILTKEKGYTVVALREILSDSTELNDLKAVVSNAYNNIGEGAFVFEYQNKNKYTINFGKIISGLSFPTVFSYQNSLKYNSKDIGKGDFLSTDKLLLFSVFFNRGFSKVALYALEIYDHDLTDEEIESVKEAMYNEYLTATNALQNHIIADY